MKKALIIFCIIFALTLAVPAVAAITGTYPSNESTKELVTIFSGNISTSV